MATDFDKVSLGFAEFVSQLIRETFEAVLDAQHYQLEKFDELRNAAHLSTASYRQQYISDDEFNGFQRTTLGFLPKENMALGDAELAALRSLLPSEDLSGIVGKGRLTKAGWQRITSALLDQLVAVKKSQLQAMLNHPELARLMVDSGEIRARLELFCLNESDKATPPKSTAGQRAVSGRSASASKTNFDIREIRAEGASGAIVREVVDNATQLKTLLIDRRAVGKADASRIPSARLVANPVSATTSATVFSEITIKFKSL